MTVVVLAATAGGCASQEPTGPGAVVHELDGPAAEFEGCDMTDGGCRDRWRAFVDDVRRVRAAVAGVQDPGDPGRYAATLSAFDGFLAADRAYQACRADPPPYPDRWPGSTGRGPMFDDGRAVCGDLLVELTDRYREVRGVVARW